MLIVKLLWASFLMMIVGMLIALMGVCYNIVWLFFGGISIVELNIIIILILLVAAF